MKNEHIVCSIQDRIAVVTIDRPQFLNALNKKTIEELSICFQDLEGRNEVKVVVLTGAGNKAFVAGADIKEFAHFSHEQGRELSRKGQELIFNKINGFSKPVIAAVNGFALRGGLELAMSCHNRLAS